MSGTLATGHNIGQQYPQLFSFGSHKSSGGAFMRGGQNTVTGEERGEMADHPFSHEITNCEIDNIKILVREE